MSQFGGELPKAAERFNPDCFSLKANRCRSNLNLLDLVEVNLVAGAVIEFGGFGCFVVGDLLGVLDGAMFSG